MTRLRLFLSRLFGVFVKRQSRERLDEELLSHFEYLVEQNLAKGMSFEEARTAARSATPSAFTKHSATSVAAARETA
ncbi:MAG: hypothetical protein KGL59_15115 [Acidobacteriota bacterium]|nr:hypothetical protein [Acidobacteriota bacterium]